MCPCKLRTSSFWKYIFCRLQYTANNITLTKYTEAYVFFFFTSYCLFFFFPLQICPQTPQPADPSAVNINAGQQLLQGSQFLIGLLDGAVSLDVAGDVIADVVYQRNRVGLVSVLQRRSVLFDDLSKLGLLHQLWQTGTIVTSKVVLFSGLSQ